MISFQKYADRILGPSLRRVSTAEKCLYLTFDDGPDPDSTPAVLDLLKRESIAASFFVIANRALAHPELITRMLNEGHSVGNHSLDHQYGNFFKGKNKLKQWISESETHLSSIEGLKSVGFRSPAGVRTPELHAALKELKLPLIHWDIRFYDTVFKLTHNRTDRALRRAQAGSILLLHDTAPVARLADFLHELKYLLGEARRLGFHFNRLCPPEALTQ